MRPTQPSGGLAASADLKFLQNVVQVILDGGGANRELARDFLIGAALLDERPDFGLTRRQGQQRLLLVGPVQLAGKAGEHRGCNIRRAVHAAFDCVHQGAVKFVRAAFARDIAAEAGGGAGKDMVVSLVECKGTSLVPPLTALIIQAAAAGSVWPKSTSITSGCASAIFAMQRGSRSTTPTTITSARYRRVAARPSLTR